jgi:hypothetical protein
VHSFGAVHIVAAETGDAAPVHHALNEIVALHPILVGGAVGEIVKIRLAQRVIFELPELLKLRARMIADGPVVVFSLDRIPERLSLRARAWCGIARCLVVRAATVSR